MTDGGKKIDDASAVEPDGSERRSYERFATRLHVDVTSGESFLFAYITNISEMGIFVHSESPLPIGTELRLRFTPQPRAAEGSAAEHDGAALELDGMVVWINPLRAHGDNPNPGMGVRFSNLTPEQRERVVALVRTVAYLQDDVSQYD